MTEARLAELLAAARTVAVVGLSPRPDRPSHRVARYLQAAGYQVIPVNPGHAAILGERSYPTVAAAAAEHRIDVVNVFRQSALAGAVVDEAIAIRPELIFLQEGVVDAAAALRAQAAGIPMVMDRCIAVDHRRLVAA